MTNSSLRYYKTGDRLKLKKSFSIEMKNKMFEINESNFPIWEVGYSDPDDSDNYYALHPMPRFSPNDKIAQESVSSFYTSIKKTELENYFDCIAS